MILCTSLLPDVQSDPACIILYTSVLPDVQSDPECIILYISLFPDAESDPAYITLYTSLLPDVQNVQNDLAAIILHAYLSFRTFRVILHVLPYTHLFFRTFKVILQILPLVRSRRSHTSLSPVQSSTGCFQLNLGCLH